MLSRCHVFQHVSVLCEFLFSSLALHTDNVFVNKMAQIRTAHKSSGKQAFLYKAYAQCSGG